MNAIAAFTICDKVGFPMSPVSDIAISILAAFKDEPASPTMAADYQSQRTNGYFFQVRQR